jgi:hypothetical protein
VDGVLPWSSALTGRIDEHVLDSAALRGNPLGDPGARPLWVHVPPGYDDGTDPLPVVYVLQGYTGHVAMWRNRAPFRQPYPELVDAVLADPTVPDGLVVYVDAWTSFGGSQYRDAPATGRYHTYLCEEVVPFVDTHYRTVRSAAGRAVTGKSSGGYGAMLTPMLRPDLFGALATHAGDALFEVCYAPSFPELVRALARYDGDVDVFLRDVRSRVPGTVPHDLELLEIIGYSAAYGHPDDPRVELPFDPRTGRLRPAAWERWLAADPVRMVEADPATAAALSAVWIDAGTRDEYHLDLGAVAYRDALLAAGLPAARVVLELFDATHAGIEYRYPLALRWLLPRLSRG